MKIYYNLVSQDLIQCPSCWEQLAWEGSDLNIDQNNTDMYFMVCPVCKERMYIKRSENLDKLYNESQH